MFSTQTVLDYFHQITQIPRCSKKEEKIRQFLIDWAMGKDLPYKVDSAGNLVVYVPTTPDKQSKETVILQSHIDMVCVKAPDSNHDFDTDPITVIEKDGRLTADATTLGADNGVGVAMMMAVVDIDSHPPLELLFTVDEEQGLTGAMQLDTTLLQGKKIINLDTEDEGEVCISSAGGGRIDVSLPLLSTDKKLPIYHVQIQGLRGGHSGVEIDQNRGNAIIAILQLLQQCPSATILYAINGGVADNAIPADCTIDIGIEDITAVETLIPSFMAAYQSTYDAPDMDVIVKKTETDYTNYISHETVQTILGIHSGIHSIHPHIDGLVQTSINLGIIRTDNALLSLTYAPRSSNTAALDTLIAYVEKHYMSAGGKVTLRGKYPGWEEHPTDAFVQFVAITYGNILGYDPKVVAYHAGLECGAIVQKLGSDAHAVSFGPTIKDPHSIHERCQISSIETSWKTLQSILQNFQ